MKKFEITWEERHKAIIEAENYEEAYEKAQELDSSYETYQERVHQEVAELEEQNDVCEAITELQKIKEKFF